MEIAIVRYYNVYGPHQDFKRTSPPLTSYIVRELLHDRVPILHASGHQERDYVYVDDVNRLNMLCMTHPNAPGQVFNAASGKGVSVRQIYHLLAKALGKSHIEPAFREAGKFWDKYPGLFEGTYPLPISIIEKEVNKFTFGSAELAHTLLGWQPQVSLEEGMQRTAEYAQKSMSDITN
jgi:nucleoside-diphosphate-sugar epimerase